MRVTQKRVAHFFLEKTVIASAGDCEAVGCFATLGVRMHAAAISFLSICVAYLCTDIFSDGICFFSLGLDYTRRSYFKNGEGKSPKIKPPLEFYIML
jgi:hypothetical protein